ncbi:site-specific DNA-methyltransferase [Skermanella pratensis]|uniref:site-specific DNA-methyltransferase n=1 Tax=Skermanella pratensis TaxID=2233999 RepID=UPI001300FB8F|nr:DNA methyltransferase [Skermanella pratensis]
MSLAVSDAALRQSKRLKQLRDKLDELFQLDRGDLDFGIYRIINLRREEVRGFLANDLLPQVRDALSQYQPADKAELQRQLDQAIAGALEHGIDPNQSPRVRDLRTKLAEAPDLGALEEAVYGHLHSFFSRYYKDGDFLSLRRYKEGVYAIPYEGEEVKLHWANHDQYYVKSAENLRTYAFRTGDGRRVRFELALAGTEQDNVKAPTGRERRFHLHVAAPIQERADEDVPTLTILFEYRPDDQDRKQEELSADAIATLHAREDIEGWRAALFAPAPTEANAGRTLLGKHLAEYTARWTFDYFIHKDLGGFLRRELDFYIKNEVLYLDDIDQATAPVAEQQLSAIRAIRRVAHKIIDFLMHIEDAQKVLWLKKKFVLETQWCITLDRIFAVRENAKSEKERAEIDGLLADIAGNNNQRKDWVKLFAIDRIADAPAGTVAYAVPLTVEFLCANPFLVLDTKWFPEETFPGFKDRLLGLFDDLDEQTDGLLVHGENFGALNLLLERYRNKIQSIYADPPYNTDAEPINYKNGYKSSSWISMLRDRVALSKLMLSQDGIACITIDDFQYKELAFLCSEIFSSGRVAATVPIRSNPSGRPTPTGFGQAHEYAIFLQNSDSAPVGKLTRSVEQSRRYKEQDEDGKAYMWELFRKRGSGSERHDRPTLFYPIYAKGESVRIPAMEWSSVKREWKILEEPDADEVVILPIDENGVERRWRGKPASVVDDPDRYLAKTGPGGINTVYYKYSPGQEIIPPTLWIDAKYSATEHGTAPLREMFREYNVFSYPKSVFAVEDCLQVSGMKNDNSYCLDFFGGSGTTGQVIINMNRKDGGSRKFVLVEVEKHFDYVLKPRICKAVYSSNWKGGVPLSSDGISHIIKYIRLESYEDTLDNLEVQRSPERQGLFDRQPAMREGYMLRYLLDTQRGDIAGSPSLLNIDAFAEPFRHTLRITRDDETRELAVDLPETFNYLLGLKVTARQRVRGVLSIFGTLPDGGKVLILWRSLSEVSNADLDEWFRRSHYSTLDLEFHTIWVNGDNNLENLRRPGIAEGGQEDNGALWKVRLIERDFKRLMFDTRSL